MLNAKENYHLAGPGFEEEKVISRAAPATDEAAKALDADPPKGDIPDLIAELAELHQQGTISDEEFQTKKTELLARL